MSRKPKQPMPSEVKEALSGLSSDIRLARLRRGVSLRQMAVKLGVATSTYVRLEKGDPGSAELLLTAMWALGFLPRLSGLIAPETDLVAAQAELAKVGRSGHKRGPKSSDQRIDDLDF